MSESSAAEERRQIRKAFGERAIEAFDRHAEAIAQLSADCREAFAQHKEMIDKLIARVESLERWASSIESETTDHQGSIQ